MSLGTPNWVLTDDFSYQAGTSGYDMKTIPQGTFARPIELCYVPKHVTEDRRWIGFDKETHIFCYTKEGIIPIPRMYLRKS